MHLLCGGLSGGMMASAPLPVATLRADSPGVMRARKLGLPLAGCRAWESGPPPRLASTVELALVVRVQGRWPDGVRARQLIQPSMTSVPARQLGSTVELAVEPWMQGSRPKGTGAGEVTLPPASDSTGWPSLSST